MTTQRKRRLRRLTLGMVAVSLMLTAVGCSNGNKPVGGDEFPAEGVDRHPVRFERIQAASGARADANLWSAHFDGGRLNSLGTQKLSLMLQDDDDAAPLVVCIAAKGSPELTEARTESVVAFLTDSGLKREQIELKDGPNPDVRQIASMDSAVVPPPYVAAE
jgi:hypothetical protein